MNLIDRIHRFGAELGLKPALIDGVIATVLLAVANWLLMGQPLDLDGIKAAVYAVILGLIALFAPAAPGVTTADAINLSRATDPQEGPPDPATVQHRGAQIAHRVAHRRAPQIH